MLHLLKIEWLKIKNYRTFWIIFILFLISIIGANYFTHEIQEMIFSKEAKKDPTNAVVKMFVGNPPYSFPMVWQMAAQVASYLLIIPGLLTIILFTNEYSYKTHRQNIIDGLTRKQFISSKILFVTVTALIYTAMVGITAIIFGSLGDKAFSVEKIQYLGYAFLQALNYCFFALMLSVLFRRSGITMGVYFLYVVIFDNILFHVLNKYLDNTGYFLPVESSDGLIIAPIFQSIQEHFLKRPDANYILISCLVYIAVFVYVSYQRFQKADQ